MTCRVTVPLLRNGVEYVRGGSGRGHFKEALPLCVVGDGVKLRLNGQGRESVKESGLLHSIRFIAAPPLNFDIRVGGGSCGVISCGVQLGGEYLG